MVTLTLSNDQVVDLIKQLPPDGKKAALNALQTDANLWWEIRLAQGEAQLERLAKARGLDWNVMSEDERERFIDDLLHEKP
jgi:hypothetical protein